MPKYIIKDLDGPGDEIHESAHYSGWNMGRRTTGSGRRHIGHSRSPHHQQIYHGGGQVTSLQPGSSLLWLQKSIQQTPPLLDDKGVRMDWNTEVCDQAYQRFDEELKNEIGDLRDDEKITTWWIQVFFGFLQGDSYSLIGFCISEISVCILLQHSPVYRMGEPGNCIVKRTHSLFVDDLKVYPESCNVLKNVNKIIVQANHNTGACYGVPKCAETYSNMARWWEEVFMSWNKEWRPCTQIKNKSLKFKELNRVMVSELQ